MVSGSNPATREAVVENYRLGELPCVEVKLLQWLAESRLQRCGVTAAAVLEPGNGGAEVGFGEAAGGIYKAARRA